MNKVNLNVLVLALLFNFLNLNAQELSVTNQTINYDDQDRPCIKVILKPGTKTVKKAYRDWMEDNQDVDVDGFGFLKNKDVLKIEKSNIAAISNNKMDLYAKIVEEGDYTAMYVFGSMGYDLHIGPQTYLVEYRKMNALIFAFLNDFLPGYYQEKVENTQDLIGDLREDEEDARDQLTDNKEEIENLRKENEELADKIRDYEKRLDEQTIKLQDQKEDKSNVTRKIKTDNDK